MSKYIKTSMESYSLTEEQLEFFDKNGYLRVEKAFSQEEMDIVRGHMDEFANGFFTNYLDMHNYKSLKEIHRGKKMCDVADAIFRDARAIPIGSIAFFCKPDNKLENGSTWHQDNYAGRSTPDSYLNVALAVDQARPENGSLMVVPGSHKLGDLPCNPKANFSIDEQNRLYNSAPIGNDCALPEDLPIVHLSYNPGDMLIVHGLLVHKAEKNTHPTKWRRTMYNVYVREHEPFWPGWTAKRSLLDRYDSPGCSDD